MADGRLTYNPGWVSLHLDSRRGANRRSLCTVTGVRTVHTYWYSVQSPSTPYQVHDEYNYFLASTAFYTILYMEYRSNSGSARGTDWFTRRSLPYALGTAGEGANNPNYFVTVWHSVLGES